MSGLGPRMLGLRFRAVGLSVNHGRSCSCQESKEWLRKGSSTAVVSRGVRFWIFCLNPKP